ADRADHPRDFGAGRERQRRLVLVPVLDDEDVGKVHAGCLDAHHHLARLGGERRKLLDHQGIRRSPRLAQNRFHRRAVSSRYLPSSRRAIWSRWTSSGPSAKRRMRARAHWCASGKSWHTPPPPCAWIAQSSTFSAMLGAATLIIAISRRATLLPTVSIMYAAFSTSSRACSIMMRASAMRSRVTPCSASVLPNGARTRARLHII